jgi:SPW repeat-containing protein
MKRREAALDLYNAILGAFLFVSPWLFAMSYGPARVDAFASGAVLMAASLLAIVAFREWEEWINLAIGIWVLASPWVLHFPHRASMHITVFVGSVVTFLALLELWLIHNPGWTEPDAAATPRHEVKPRKM